VSIVPKQVPAVASGGSYGALDRPDGPMDTSSVTEGLHSGVSGEAGKGTRRQKKGACAWHAPSRKGCYLLLGRVVRAGSVVPASGTVGGTTVGLVRLRSGLIPNSTNLSLPWPKCCLAIIFSTVESFVP
jgi:hypothetical protein